MRASRALIPLTLALASAAQPAPAQMADPRVMGQVFPACTRPPVPDDHVFVAANAYEGDTLANVLLGSQDEVSTIVRVAVAPGAQPITLFVSGHDGLIWDFDGDVGRVQRVIATSTGNDGRVAVRGVAADRVEFPMMRNCPFSYHAQRPADLETQKRMLAVAFGRAPDRAVYEYSAHELALPEASFRPLASRPPAGKTLGSSRLNKFHPGGFRELDPGTLLSPVAITVPETHPAEAGLVQLEQSGVIRPPRPEEVAAWIEGASRPFRSKLSPDFRLRMAFDYVVTRDTLLPAGLYGAHSKNFLVLAGVSPPRGKPGHGCLALADGFQVGDNCWGEEHDAVRRLNSWPTAAELPACRLIEAPPGASFDAVSAYEPDGAQHSFGSRRKPVPIAVRVFKPGDVVLVLNTYEPAIWRVSFGPNTRIVGVLMTGYYASSVEGVAPSTPVIATGYDGQALRPKPDPACAPYHGYLGTAYRGGPDALVLDRQVKVLAGGSLDSLRGAYSLKEAEIGER